MQIALTRVLQSALLFFFLALSVPAQDRDVPVEFRSAG